ncbi:MAG: PorV/PorQ family protein, partial [Spirochaetes bacterium]|nr:PorV/PorQ family protein [Spirochaetota bacterium]
MNKFITAIIIFFFMSGLLFSAEVGTSGAPFLKIGTSSRYIGRGEAFNAMVDDPTALTENVAGLANIHNLEILFSHYEWLLDLDYEHLAVVKPVFKGLYDFQGVLGFGITYMHVPAFAQYDDWGEDIGQLNANSLAFITGYGQKLYMFDIGFSFKIIREQIDDITDYGFGTDFGLIYTYKFPRKLLGLNTFGKSLKVAMTLQNITLDDGINGYKLPTIFKFGLGSEIFNDFQIEVDFEKPFDADLRINTGL